MSELYKVGNDVKMRFHRGALELYSNGGTLWPDWLERASIDRWSVRSVRVAKGTVKLPESIRGFDMQKKVFTMFGGLSQVKSIDLNSFDTSNVTNMSFMFSCCHTLTALDLSGLDTSRVIDMSAMFASCRSIKGLDLSSFDTSNVTDMGGMFCDCDGLAHLNLSGLDTSNVTSISCMFCNCKNLTNIDMSGFNTSHILDMRSLFEGCGNLRTVIMNPAVNQDTKTDRMFEDCQAEIIYI